ncbi:MAG: DUF2330 domain-containing protein, partial [Proteobacteria bacterium]|nr:DUF2330 domain-containing protein [Pseudomonadota bacterium]
EVVGACEIPMPSAEFDLAAGVSMEDGVTVVSEERVGPYDTVVLQALNADVLLDWLQTEGYDLPSDLSTVLSPYVADNQHFIALKLASGQDTGDLTPLGMRYDACSASVPLQLTAIAANADMPVDVYVIGESRAVPDNYLHVTMNDASIDWWTGGANFSTALSTAADEAGGQAFSTTYSGPIGDLSINLYSGGFNEADLASYTDAEQFVRRLTDSVPLSAEVTAVLSDYFTPPDGVSPANYFSCMSCWGPVDQSDFDAAVIAARIADEVIPGLEEADAAIGAGSHLTRLTTTMDPEEMTVDPIFVLNADLPQDVSNLHSAEQKVNCGFLEGRDGGERKLMLEDGRVIKLPSRRWQRNHNTTEFELIAELTTPAAILIEDFSAEGPGEIVFDYREDAARDARRFGRPGCACTSAPSPLSMAALALLLPVALRRRS